MTDPYVVKCPACLAEAGERCTNHIRPLDTVHWSRHRLARRQRSGRRMSPSNLAPRQLASTVRGGRGRSG